MFVKLLLLCAAIVMMTDIASAGPSEKKNSMPKGFGLSIATDKAIYGSEEPITITLTIFNYTEDSLTFTFTNSQRYDFSIRREEKEMWRWSTGKVFAQMMGDEKIEPGAGLSYTETYKPQAKLMPGVYSVTGMLTFKDPPGALRGTVCIRLR